MAFREHKEHGRKQHRSQGDYLRREKLQNKSTRRSASPTRHESNISRPRHLSTQALLPLNASPISKHDFPAYKPVFALYLDVQKRLSLECLPDTEIRGRWKSFVGKWNRGDLAEGWYDPATLEKAINAANENESQHRVFTRGKSSLERNGRTENAFPVVESDDEDAPGPSLPETYGHRLKSLQSIRAGPAIPDFQDLELRKELAAEDTHIARKATRDQRKADREQEKGRLEELVPHAAAGTKERMLEKKRENSDANRAFAAGKLDSGGVAEVHESDLLGDEDGGLEGFKKQRNDMERKKNEREIRREEVMRAREAEREERVKQYREKEETTMKTLVELARARFG